MSSSRQSCLYKQVVNIVPLLGGLTTFDPDFNKCVFDYIPYSPDLIITTEGYQIRVTSGAKSLLFYRLMVVFRDDIKPASKIRGCAILTEYVETPPVVLIDQTRTTLSVGSTFLTEHGRTVLGVVEPMSYDNKNQIAKDLYWYIQLNPSESSSPEGSCVSEMDIYVLTQTTTQTKYALYFTNSNNPCSFKSWYMASPESGSMNPMPGTTNQFLANFPAGGSSTYNIGHTDVNSWDSQVTLYSPISFPISGSTPGYPIYAFTPNTYL